jgi:hypothetical protein
MLDSSSLGTTTSGYRSYLVRFWRSHEDSRWHASAQCVQTGSTSLFGEIEQLLQFLRTEFDSSPTPAEGKHDPSAANPLCGSAETNLAEGESDERELG